MTGTLYLVPSLLGAVPPASVLPVRTIEVAQKLDHWLVETPKPARAFLKTIGSARPIAELAIHALSGSSSDAQWALATLRGGHDVGLLSDAGCPGVADPGAVIVAAAHAARIHVVPLVGPSAVLLALMAAGMNGQRFTFHGYLPVKAETRAGMLRTLEQHSRIDGSTELFIETPYRNVAMLDALARTLQPSTRVCIAADLTLDTETIECMPAEEWRREDHSRFDRRPVIFLLQASK
ncbi:MAG TPA: SAM-dependent methyltransferase [Casimicrobiaceae bacterium]|nr:SAM-dependent methyltransferase [Casimicrobiaceae bacterium]